MFHKNIKKKSDIQYKKIDLLVFPLKIKELESFHTYFEVRNGLQSLYEQNKIIGFVPTMGALHEGHLSLVREAQKECDYVIVSIFVNPTQFNNTQDLALYPRQETKDIALLESIGTDFVFIPTVEVIYPPNYQAPSIDLIGLDTVMEGEFRPGHFQGVVNVVSRLFDIVQPTIAYFGRKDFQQVSIIKHITKTLNQSVTIREVDTIRNQDGLALSSRNARLSEQELKDAVIISKVLKQGIQWARKFTPQEVLEYMVSEFNKSKLKLEYIQIVHPETLKEITHWVPGATACIASYCGDVRLIDNMELIPSN